MISDTLWRHRYGGDAGVVGRTIRIGDAPGTIIGIMPQDMHFPFNADLWIPTGAMSTALSQQPRQARGYFAVGRLADGVSVEQSRSELQTIGKRLAEQYPGDQPRSVAARRSLPAAHAGSADPAPVLVAPGCRRVCGADRLFERREPAARPAARRSGEMSVRVAIGASRWNIVRQLLIESLLLAFIAGAVGLLLSMVGIRWFAVEAQNVGVPYWMVFTMDWRTFGFLLALCLATGVIFGLAPALHASKTNVNEMLKEGGRTGSGGLRARRWTAGLIIVQVALTLVLLAGSGLMLRSFLTMYRMDIGIQTDHLVTADMIIPRANTRAGKTGRGSCSQLTIASRRPRASMRPRRRARPRSAAAPCDKSKSTAARPRLAIGSRKSRW